MQERIGNNTVVPETQEYVLYTDGMFSDAKAELPALSDNQPYANLSVDGLRTESGKGVPGGGMDIREITLEVIVSADIIEYIN